MADDEELLFELKINKGSSQADVDKFTNSITTLTAANRDLVAIQDSLKKSGDVLSTQYQQNAATIEANKQKLAEDQAARKALITVMNTEEGSVKNLTASNKLLIIERNKLSDSTEAGRKKIGEINAVLDKNTAAIKENVSGTEKQRMEIGNYTGALDKLVPGLGSTVNGIIGMTKASLAFIATPVGLVLAAIAAALALVSQYFTRTEEGGDLLTKRMDQLSAIFNVLLDRAAMLGGALVKLFAGDVVGAAQDVGQAVSGVADEMQREVSAAGELADILDKLEDRELNYAVAASETVNAIRLLIIESKNRTISETERIAKLKEASDLEVKTNEVLKKIRADELEAATKQIELDFNQLGVKKQLSETEMDFAKRIVANAAIAAPARKKVVDAIKAYNDAESQSLELREKIENRIDKLEQDKAAKEQKRLENKVAAELWVANFLQNLNKEKLDNDDKTYLGLQAKLASHFENVQMRLMGHIVTVVAGYQNQDKQIGDSAINLNTLLAQLGVKEGTDREAIMAKGNQLIKMAAQKYKAIAIAQAVISTLLAFANDLSKGWPVGVILGALDLAIGYANVRKIESTHFARGGQAWGTTVGGKPHSQGGTKFWGSDGTRFEAERGEGLYVLKRDAHQDLIQGLSRHNEQFGGVSWADSNRSQYAALGGPISLGSDTRLDSSRMIMGFKEVTAELMKTPIIVSVEDINVAQANKEALVRRAILNQ